MWPFRRRRAVDEEQEKVRKMKERARDERMERTRLEASTDRADRGNRH
jgi:hypothetical protein